MGILEESSRRTNDEGRRTKVEWLFRVPFADTHLLITIENQASQEDAHRLLQCVETVKGMSPEELASAFRAQLTNGEFGAKGGAGLGWIDIARKASGTLDAQIEHMREGLYACKSKVSTLIN